MFAIPVPLDTPSRMKIDGTEVTFSPPNECPSTGYSTYMRCNVKKQNRLTDTHFRHDFRPVFPVPARENLPHRTGDLSLAGAGSLRKSGRLLPRAPPLRQVPVLAARFESAAGCG